MSVLFLYNAVVAVFAFLLAANALVNFVVFKRPRGWVATGNSELPIISILVPARDEEDNIEACVRSLLALNYPNFEVLVLDDGSSDTTYSILCRLRDQDHRLRVLVGAHLPDDWYGKPHACWQLANAARGEFLLFTDADCTVVPDALLFALGGLHEHRADAMSLYPNVRCETFWERLILPLMGYIVFAFLPTPLVRGSRHHWFAPCNGAFIFLRRTTYFEVDGHRAVRRELAEDIKFAQNLKRHGKALWYGDGAGVYGVRMYHNLDEIVAGFTKNLFPAFNRVLWLLVSVLTFLTAVFVLTPFFAVLGYWEGAQWMWLPILSTAGLAAVRTGLTLRFKNDSILDALLLPVAWGIVVLIGIRSILQSYSTEGNQWKGRSYPTQ